VLLGNYQKAGYLHDDTLTILEPKRAVQQSTPKFDKSGDATPLTEPKPALVDEAVAYYETASYRFSHGLMRETADAVERSNPQLGAGAARSFSAQRK
jgi:hypothetical protein